MKSARLATVDEVDPEKLDSFLGRFFDPIKTKFLRDFGSWWHRGDQNRWVIVDGENLAGYCAVIPSKISVAGQKIEAAWWVDLLVAPEFRGKGLQRLTDDRVRSSAPLIMGFPNALAAKIHKQHGWAVRNDFRVLYMPLNPTRIQPVVRRVGWSGLPIRAAAIALKPWSSMFIRKLVRAKPRWTTEISDPQANQIEEVSSLGKLNWSTTLRDQEYIAWRYLSAPYHEEIRFFRAGRKGPAEVIGVARWLERSGRTTVRVLDIFGRIEDQSLCCDLLFSIAKSAAIAKADQVTIMVSDPRIQSAARRVGFWAPRVARFCWWSSNCDLMTLIHSHDQHWVLADSDNDSP